MNTEIYEYIKKLSKRDFFFINLINSVLGLGVIILGILGLVEGITMITYVCMFGAGALMLVLNFIKGVKRGSKGRWFFLTAGIVFAVIAGFFFWAMTMIE